MYSLMIVEDEDMIRLGLAKGVPWNELGFEMVGQASNGQDAFDLLLKREVDVLLTDIKMPIMDGIALSKLVRETFPETEIVILSGFSEFEYAREAINFNAFEYLLKPTDRKKIVETFTAIRSKLDLRREEREALLSRGAVLSEGTELLRRELLTELLETDRQMLGDLDERMNQCELDLTGNLFTAAIVRADPAIAASIADSLWDGDRKMLSYACRNIVNEVLSETERCAAVVQGIGEIRIVFCFETAAQQQKYQIRLCENIVNYMKKFIFCSPQMVIRVGMGLTYQSIFQLSRSFTQAKKALDSSFFDRDGCISQFKGGLESEFEQQWIRDYPDEAQQIVSYVADGNIVQTETMIHEMFVRFTERKINPDLIKNYCVVLKFMLQTGTSVLSAEGVINENFEETVKGIGSIDQLQHYIIKTFTNVARHISSITSDELINRNLIIDMAKDYIKENYDKKLTLQDICEEVYLSPNYFSCLFKKVTGETYMDYLKNVRMDQAKRLLFDPKRKVYEIAAEIGYSDYKYFTTQFKKMIGLSPKEYRESIVAR
ncbi:helix-turn-helix domain-containing protein [Oscillospiraceae bacterium PP1C4]